MNFRRFHAHIPDIIKFRIPLSPLASREGINLRKKWQLFTMNCSARDNIYFCAGAGTATQHKPLVTSSKHEKNEPEEEETVQNSQIRKENPIKSAEPTSAPASSTLGTPPTHIDVDKIMLSSFLRTPRSSQSSLNSPVRTSDIFTVLANSSVWPDSNVKPSSHSDARPLVVKSCPYKIPENVKDNRFLATSSPGSVSCGQMRGNAARLLCLHQFDYIREMNELLLQKIQTHLKENPHIQLTSALQEYSMALGRL